MSYLQDDDPHPDSQRAKDRRRLEDLSFMITWSIILICIAVRCLA